MRLPITIEEEAHMPRSVLARSIGLCLPLSVEALEDVIDAGLATDEDFEPSGDPPTYTYIGDRFRVEFRSGRPILVESVIVPAPTVRSAVAEEEARCALVMDVLGMVKGSPLTDAEIAGYRADGWTEILDESARRDRDEPGRGSPVAEWHETRTRRLGRAREILGAPAVVPRRLVGDDLDDGDAWRIGRYLLIIIARVVDQLAECRIEFAEETDEMLARMSELLTTAEGLLGIYDLDADDDDRRVGITISTSLTNDADQSQKRSI